MTASQIAEELGGVSRNAVIGKAHRLGLQSRPSPVKPNEPAAAKAAAPAAAAAAPRRAPAPAPGARPPSRRAASPPPAPRPRRRQPTRRPPPRRADAQPDGPVMRSVGPGGFLRQSPGEQQPPITPAPPRRLVPAKPSAPRSRARPACSISTTSICKWPLGHPGEPDFHFCGDKVNPGFPYCVAHCGHAYQAQLPRRDRRPPPPLPFGGPRVR